MEKQNYTATIEVTQSARDVFNAINDVTSWWSRDFEGSSIKLNDEFIINHPDQHYSKQKLIEVVPGKKIVWLITDSTLYWLKKDKQEWTNTKMIFEISTQGNKTVLHFTHEGLIPEKECYVMCAKGWDIVIKNWLFHFITTGTPSIEMTKSAEIRNQHFEGKNKMENKNYTATIEVKAPAEKAFKSINNVSEWWCENLEGSSHKLNDIFIIHFSGNNFVTHKIVEFVPDKKVVWHVTDCYLEWLADKTEWTNTKMSFEIITKGSSTQINFTHIGLVPEVECYDMCVKGWDQYVKGSLLKLITEGKGQPQPKK